MACQLCLIRHGETDWNLARRIQGSTDIPLNATGRRQARRLAAGLRDETFDAAYSSDLRRAVQTAETVIRGGPLTLRIDPALRERHYGSFQGLTQDEARSRFPGEYAALKRRDPDAVLPDGGESRAAFSERVVRALDRIADAHPTGSVLVVAHGGVLGVAYRLGAGLPIEKARDFPLRNASLNRMERAGHAWHILAWDDRAFLGPGLDERP